MSHDIWIGAAISSVLSLPVGIAGGLLVRPVQRWLDSRGQARAVAKLRQKQNAYQERLFFYGHPELFTHHLLYQALRLIFATASMSIGFIVALAALTPLAYAARTAIHLSKAELVTCLVFAMLGLVLNTLGTGLSVFTVQGTLSVFRDVRDFDKYLDRVPAQIRSPEIEQVAQQRHDN